MLLPKSQELEYEGRRYKTDEDGMYITRADRELPNHNEDSYDASDIYPSRVGTVSEVIAVDAANNLYDIKDSSIPDDLDAPRRGQDFSLRMNRKKDAPVSRGSRFSRA